MEKPDSASTKMAAGLNIASAVAGLLSLAIDVTQLTQSFVSGISRESSIISMYLEELIALKKVLSDVQDMILLYPQTATIFEIMPSSLLSTTDLRDCQHELEQLYHTLRQRRDNASLSATFKRLAWPFKEDETGRLVNVLRRCRDNIQVSLAIDGLCVPQH